MADSWEHVFFRGTQYPLKVCYIEGALPGPTVMVQGGIQGDETSGFVTAQILSRVKALRGNLIVLPRANVPSINLRARQVNVDMNRRFDQDYNRFYEDRVARVIRFLLSRSDAFIHLHEGSGFYTPVWVDSMRNPKRYGQSIIIDSLRYKTIDLADTVNGVLEELNRHIPTGDYQFRLFNTRTFERGTNYPEMRKSLTCYALSELGIPAMAVEVSKDIIQLDWKVRHQLAATVLLLKRLGVDAVAPSVNDADISAYARMNVDVRVNGRSLKGGSLNLAPGATLAVETRAGGLETFEPTLALFASDRPGVNLMNARRMVLEPFSELELRSDGRRVARARINWTGRLPESPGGDKPVFVCWLNGNPTFVREGEVLRAVEGDQLILEGIWGSHREEVINFKGFVAIPWANNGQDMGWEIILDPDNFMDKYRMKHGKTLVAKYRVVRETPGVRRSEFRVEVEPRRVLALRLADPYGQSLLIPWTPGGAYHLPAGEYELEGTWSNGPSDKIVATAGNSPVETGGRFRLDAGSRLTFEVRQATTFGTLGNMTFSSGGLALNTHPGQ